MSVHTWRSQIFPIGAGKRRFAFYKYMDNKKKRKISGNTGDFSLYRKDIADATALGARVRKRTLCSYKKIWKLKVTETCHVRRVVLYLRKMFEGDQTYEGHQIYQYTRM